MLLNYRSKMEPSKQNPDASPSGKLVQLNRGASPSPASLKGRITGGPVVDKFFALGAIFGFVGTVGYGLYLWLALNNILPISTNYFALREAHAVIQVFLFFGLFVLGFISQAGAKIVGVDLRFGKKPLLILPVYIVGSIGIIWGQTLGQFIVCAIFAFYSLSIAYHCSKGCPRPLHAVLAVTGLAVLAASPFLSLNNPTSVLLVMWGGFGTLIFAAGGQFIGAFLGGKNLVGRTGLIFLAVHLVSIALVSFASKISLDIIATLALLSLLSYFVATNISGWLSSFISKPLGLAFCSGYLWAVIAWALHFLDGSTSADLVVHILATGWAAPIILGVSSQVIAFTTGKDSLLPPRLWWWLLALWQVVPLGRGAFHFVGLPSGFSVVVAAASLVVLASWVISLIRAEWKMLSLQSELRKGEILKTCG
jgi:hypothetical protein